MMRPHFSRKLLPLLHIFIFVFSAPQTLAFFTGFSNYPQRYSTRKATKQEEFTIKSEPDLETQLDYARNGHCVLRQILDPQQLLPLRIQLWDHGTALELSAWKQKVQVASTPELAEQCTTVEECQMVLYDLGIYEELPFLQYFHTWRTIPEAFQLAKALAPIAAKLMDVPTVRLYQDSLFWKRPGDGPTPWHTDARMAPFDTSHMITIWVPLQNVDSTGLVFCPKSHSDFALPYWNSPDSPAWADLEVRYSAKPVDYMPLKVGDATCHSGWTLHCADENLTEDDRLALAIAFVDARAPIRFEIQSDLHDNEDLWSYEDWVTEVEPAIREWDHPSVPILYRAEKK